MYTGGEGDIEPSVEPRRAWRLFAHRADLAEELANLASWMEISGNPTMFANHLKTMEHVQQTLWNIHVLLGGNFDA